MKKAYGFKVGKAKRLDAVALKYYAKRHGPARFSGPAFKAQQAKQAGRTFINPF